jgi:polar amino acid transport system ATP-binding protein
MSILNVENLHKYFGKNHVLKGIDLSVSKGEVLSVIGPSGSGKSTLLRCLNHLETAESGSICIDGEYIAKADADGKAIYLPNSEILKISSKLGMVFQNFNLFPHRSVLENLIEAPIYVKKMSKKDAIDKAQVLLDKVGLNEKKDAYPCELSGGQQQRVAIARALAMDPEIMLFDEPTSALDPELIGEVLKVIKSLVNDDTTMVIVTHEMNFAAEVSNRIIFMDEGEILAEGSPQSIVHDPDNPRIQAFLHKIVSKE